MDPLTHFLRVIVDKAKQIPIATSIIDYVFRWLELKFDGTNAAVQPMLIPADQVAESTNPSVAASKHSDAVASGVGGDLAERITRATRVFARRQRTWLRSQPVRWLDPGAAASGDLRVLVAPATE